MTDCMSSTFLLPREKVPSCKKKNVSYSVQTANGLVWLCPVACLLVRLFRFVVLRDLHCKARCRNVCRLRETCNRNHDGGRRNVSTNVHQTVRRNIQSHHYSSRKAYPIRSEQATGHPPNHHNQSKNSTYPLLCELTGALVLSVSQEFDDAALIGGKTDNLAGDLTDEGSTAGRLALAAADLVLGGAVGRGFLLSTRRSHVSSTLFWQGFCFFISKTSSNVSVPKSELEDFSWSTHVKFVPACIFPVNILFSHSVWQYVPPLQPNHKASKPNSFSGSTWGLNIKTGRDKKTGDVNVRGPCSSRPRFRSVLAPSRRLMTWGGWRRRWLLKGVVEVRRSSCGRESRWSLAGFWLAARRSA